MEKRPIYTCSNETCHNCTVNSKINCHFNIWQLIRFYITVLPSFIIGAIGIGNFDNIFLIIWIGITVLFFLIIEIRVLCTHCPHYGEPTITLRCWANYWAPKLWKFKPEPMHVAEKIILMAGFTIVFGYPVIFLLSLLNWFLLIGYLLSVLLFFILLKRLNCKICMNFSCPLNGVGKEVKEKFLENNSLINSYEKKK